MTASFEEDDLTVLARVRFADEFNYPSDVVLRQYCDDWFYGNPNRKEVDPVDLCRGAIRMFAQASAAIPVSERLPEPGVKVLAYYFNKLGKGRTICAIWVPAKSRSDDADFADDDFTEYDEEDDKYYWPEGWYEVIENWDEFGFFRVYEGEVVYWQPFPRWPTCTPG